MGKRRRKNYPTVEELLTRPWCYYCERAFDDLKILIDHQKAKHFKCDRCHRRLNTAGGLSVHMTQVHKEQLTVVENALDNRKGLDVEIFGMEGIPDDIRLAHEQRVMEQFYQEQAERRAKSGNLAPGDMSKRRKIVYESKAEMLERYSEFLKRKKDPNYNPLAPSQKFLPQQGQSFQSQFATGPRELPQRPGYFNAPLGATSSMPTDVDDLIASALNEPPQQQDKKTSSKKDKEKTSRLVYSNNDVSPEEKMAVLPRFAVVAK